ncbi:hypothetical protein GOC74_08675 [Halomicrobium mukohataei]|uniref:Uncharacterized protein n=1 Tax=Halomicrobium mukohataei TaxID=57705 RepID=A0A847U2X7_9EURY|nr:hypothetical protein [Halomicrobium mukohataei]NLV10003.1 hypothetical protein [Halomicrobium mukohataei]
MRFLLLFTLTVVSLAVVAPAGATPTGTETAGNNTTLENVTTELPNPQPTSQGSEPEPTDTTRIDENTVLVDSEYRANESVALLTIRSKTVQTLTFSDGGQFRQGGKVPVTVEPFRAGETATIEVPVTEVNGWVGVAISTENTRLYSEIVKQPSAGGLDILRALSSLQAWFAGVLVAFTWMVIAGYNVLRREDGSPRVAT